MIDQINSVCFSLTLTAPCTFKTFFISTRFKTDFDGSVDIYKGTEKRFKKQQNSKKMNENYTSMKIRKKQIRDLNETLRFSKK